MKVKKSIMIFGGGDLALEVAVLIEQLNQTGANWEVKGFVVEDQSLFGSQVYGYPVVSGVGALVKEHYQGAAAIAVGSPKIAHRIKAQIDETGLSLHFPTLVHPSVVADFNNLILEEGVIINAGCLLTTQIHLGAFTYANVGCSIGHATKTGRYCRINPQAHIAGGVELEDFAYIGSGTMVMEYKKIGKGAQVSLGSVVSADVRPWTVMAGNPARAVKELEPWLEILG